MHWFSAIANETREGTAVYLSTAYPLRGYESNPTFGRFAVSSQHIFYDYNWPSEIRCAESRYFYQLVFGHPVCKNGMIHAVADALTE
jgi:hypothetical protein